MLIDGLPPESLTSTRLRNEAAERRQAADAAAAVAGAPPPEDPGGRHDPAASPWSAQNMLLAAIVDEQRLLRWLYLSAHSEKGQRPVRPALVERPGVTNTELRPHATRLTADQRRRLDPRLRAASHENTPQLEAAGDGGMSE